MFLMSSFRCVKKFDCSWVSMSSLEACRSRALFSRSRSHSLCRSLSSRCFYRFYSRSRCRCRLSRSRWRASRGCSPCCRASRSRVKRRRLRFHGSEANDVAGPAVWICVTIAWKHKQCNCMSCWLTYGRAV